MTATATANGKPQRKSLASQLDRLDSMLDGLDQGLQGAITDAVKEAVTIAVAEGVRTALVELATNPELLAVIRGGVPAEPTPAVTAPETKPESKPWHHRVRQGLSRVWQGTIGKLRAVTNAVTSRVRAVRDGVTGSVRQVNRLFGLKKPLLLATGVGLVAGVVAYLAAPWVAGVCCGMAAATAAMGVQIAAWARRMLAYVPAFSRQ
jgi:hypothetical protein